MDQYPNFDTLRAERQEGLDFRVRTVEREGAKVVVVAPHGGAIEPGCSELALAVAADDLSYALFEGMQSSNNGELHITSTHFDEPRCLALVARTHTAIAIHGERGSEAVVYLGGANLALCTHLGDALNQAGFTVKEHSDPRLQGTSAQNICNRGLAGSGVQLELSRGLRASFFASLNKAGRTQPTDAFYRFIEAVRQALRGARLL